MGLEYVLRFFPRSFIIFLGPAYCLPPLPTWLCCAICQFRAMTEPEQPPSSSKSPSHDYHPPLSVNNICNSIPLILDRDKVHYSNWVELFECHAHDYSVLDHIDPTTTCPTDVSRSMWDRLDSVVKQWIYRTTGLG